MTASVGIQCGILVRAVRHRSVNVSGRDAIYADSSATEIVGKRPGKSENSGFGCVISRIARKAKLSGQRADKYDSPFLNTAVGHTIGEMARPSECSLQVDIYRDLPIRVSLRHAGSSDSRIVDEINRTTAVGERL